jgi:hypothetical protein
MKTEVTLSRKIYWRVSLVLLVVMYTGQYRRHQEHKPHNFRCRCLTQCLFCAIDGLRGK